MCEFEERVKKSLNNILKNTAVSAKPCIGAAVSGGADSISLLLALSKLYSPLYVITVNHNIRPEAESGGDAAFVLEVCEKLREQGLDIVCQLVELKRGEVEKTSEERGGGIEEAARYLRYKAFEAFAASHKLDALCLAHNQNDQLETLLMRFMQGSPVEAAAGIRESRMLDSGKCLLARPLLGITRKEIEDYVSSCGFGWRTDKTNFDTDYLRNKIRLKLLPFLDENFEGWKSALLAGAEKACQDADFICDSVNQIQISDGDCVQIPLEDFLKAPEAIQRRLLLSACNKAGESGRIPHQFIKEVLRVISQNESFTKRFASVDIIKEKNKLFIKKHTESNTDLFFSDIIENTGTFEFPFGTLSVFNYREQDKKHLVSVSADEGSLVENVSLPFCVRNISPGDTVLCADGSEKKVFDILSDWHVAASRKSLVPVIQLLDDKSQRIKAVLAGFLGYKDWIVKL
jgi:tRNA(Ile)-lysidine synthase